MAHKSFKTVQSTEVITFDLEGQRFKCKPKISAGLMFQIAETMSNTPSPEDMASASNLSAEEKQALAKNQSGQVDVLLKFFRSVIVPDDRDRFFTLMYDEDVEIDLDILLDVLTWLMEQYTSRPTGAVSSPTSPPTSLGSDSTDGASPGASTYSRTEENPVNRNGMQIVHST